MLFNSFEFAIFLPVVFIIYWFLTNKSIKLQNLTILVASYFFYGWWDWRFLSLIIFSTVVDFVVGQRLIKTENRMTRKMWLWLSIVVNLGLLGVFKYYNFFLDSLYNAAPGLQAVMGFNTLSIILPVGISFYTFQTLSYTIDIYKRKLEPTNDFIAFAAYVAFFPQLVAGPIERATNLLPQFKQKRIFNYTAAVDGMRQILWGLFKKIVIADNSAVFANEIFANSDSYSGSVLLFGALFFAIQIYGDFSGYSDIAIGTARLFGINLMRNFAFPYFSRDIAEFWRRWHISLSTWFRDYLYIPLGGSRGGRGMQIRNIFVIFIVSGFWHGANWTFIAWGALHAVFFLPLLLTKKNRSHMDIAAKGKLLPSLKELMGMAFTFGLVLIAWVFFRAEDLGHAFSYLGGIFSGSLFTVPSFHDSVKALTALILISIFIIIEWLGREREYAIEGLDFRFKKPVRYAIYYAIVLVIFWAGGQEQEFIYFQF
jgi:alginate O-acetyltransferase complex protein AlgI